MRFHINLSRPCNTTGTQKIFVREVLFTVLKHWQKNRLFSSSSCNQQLAMTFFLNTVKETKRDRLIFSLLLEEIAGLSVDSQTINTM